MPECQVDGSHGISLTHAGLDGALHKALALLQEDALLVDGGAIVDAPDALHYDAY